METVYKVVRVAQPSGKRYSCMHWRSFRPGGDQPSAGSTTSGIVLEYISGKVTKPKFGQILAFDNLADANSFVGSIPWAEVWRCTTPRFKAVKLVASDTFLSRLKPFWKHQGRRRTINTMPTPPGTVTCPQVCLKELLIRNG